MEAGAKLPSHYFFRTVEHFYGAGLTRRAPSHPVRIRGADEFLEQRMWLQRLRLEFGMELAADEVRVVGQFDHLHVGSVGRGPGNSHARGNQRLFIFAVEFVSVAMAFADLGLAID